MSNKKQVRTNFRNAVFQRDRYRCRCCGVEGCDRQGEDLHKKYHKNPNPVELDAHHINSRELMPFGGYVAENGISVCTECHLKAEEHWAEKPKNPDPNYSMEKLYELIGSSLEKAEQASMRLK